MKVAVQQDDLQLLAKTLQEQLLAEVPSGGVFQVKCAVNNDGLMILIEHPVGLIVDTPTIFQLIEDVIQSLPNPQEQHVQCFLRVFGEKLPYTKRSLYINERVEVDEIGPYSHLEESPLGTSTNSPLEDANSFSSRLIFPAIDEPISVNSSKDETDSPFALPFSVNSSKDETEEEEPFDPLAGAPDLTTSKSAKLIKSSLLALAAVGIVVLGGGAYLLGSPCLFSECKPIQTAEQLKTESRRSLRRAKSEKELLALQQQLQASSSDLASIPSWSPYSQQAAQLQASLSASSQKIDQVVKALQAASLAMQKTQTPANSIQELQARQKLWRRAITPLEAMGANSEFYELAQVKLLSYRTGLQTVNQQLLLAEKWVKKLSAAKAVATNATQHEATAKSLNDLQKVQLTWQVAVNALNVIPQTSSEYQEAQKLLQEYKPKLATARDRATKEQLATKTYQQAIGTAKQAKVSEQQQQWQAAVAQWQQALQSAKGVRNDSFEYLQAQSLIEPYSAALKQAQAKLQIANRLQKTRTDLNKICTNGFPICTFTIDNKGITVRLTRQYDQARSTIPNTNAHKPDMVSGLNQHLQMLQQALGVISDNAQMPLSVYDSQGKPVYTRSLQG